MVLSSYKGRLIGTNKQKERKQKKIKECTEKANKDIRSLTEKESFVAGLGLYWGEGSKNGDNVRFYNANPLVVKFIMEWFRKSLKIEDDRFQMYVNINQIHKKRLQKVIEFWSKRTMVSVDQFRKPQLIKTKNKKVYENFSQHYGTLSIRIARSKNLLYQIMAWIDAMSKAG